tara:strand:+ start:2426 stop:2824 length:399 start_codon:yes stop_codon:yes gene_type:complete
MTKLRETTRSVEKGEGYRLGLGGIYPNIEDLPLTSGTKKYMVRIYFTPTRWMKDASVYISDFSVYGHKTDGIYGSKFRVEGILCRTRKWKKTMIDRGKDRRDFIRALMSGIEDTCLIPCITFGLDMIQERED